MNYLVFVLFTDVQKYFKKHTQLLFQRIKCNATEIE